MKTLSFIFILIATTILFTIACSESDITEFSEKDIQFNYMKSSLVNKNEWTVRTNNSILNSGESYMPAGFKLLTEEDLTFLSTALRESKQIDITYLDSVYPGLENMWSEFYIPSLELQYQYFSMQIKNPGLLKDVNTPSGLDQIEELYRGIDLGVIWADWYDINKEAISTGWSDLKKSETYSIPIDDSSLVLEKIPLVTPTATPTPVPTATPTPMPTATPTPMPTATPTPMPTATPTPMPIPILSIETYKEKGESYISSGEYSKALIEFDNVLNHPSARILDKTNAFLSKADIYVDLGEYSRAINEADMGIALMPDWPAGYIIKGRAYYSNDLWEVAISNLETAYSLFDPDLDPYDIRGYMDMSGRAYHELQNYDKSIEDYTEFINYKREIGDKNLTYTEALSWRTQSHYYLGNYEEAIQDSTEFVNYMISNGLIYKKALDWRALSHHNLGNYEEAVQDFTEFINYQRGLDTKDTERYMLSLSWRALSYYNLGKYDEVIEDYTEFIDYKILIRTKDDYYATALFWRGISYAMRIFDDSYSDNKSIEDLTEFINYMIKKGDKNVTYAEALSWRALVYKYQYKYTKADEDCDAHIAVSSILGSKIMPACEYRE